jgi:hypothetical protein
MEGEEVMDIKYLSLYEAAKQVHRNTRTLKRLAEEGKLPGAVWEETLQRWAIPESALAFVVPHPGRPFTMAGITYLPMKEYARLRRISRQRVYQLIAAGQIVARRFDKRIFISEQFL